MIGDAELAIPLLVEVLEEGKQVVVGDAEEGGGGVGGGLGGGGGLLRGVL